MAAQAHLSSIDAQDSALTHGLKARQSEHIDHRQVRNIIRAERFAERAGRPLNFFVTINLGHTACEADNASKVFERLRDNHYTKWLRDIARRRDQPSWLPAFYVWSIEDKPGHPNIHWLIHKPVGLRSLFESKLHVWLERLAGPLNNSQTPILIKPATTPTGVAKYLSKGINPRYAKLFRINPIPQGIIKGKRAGISAALGPAAIAHATIINLAIEVRGPQSATAGPTPHHLDAVNPGTKAPWRKTGSAAE